ncbi:MAG: tetratricopeptide repeat protein [Reyranella sp.]|nr:tetratricopeptide repeat protein [Reyranella sp.]
MSEDLEWAWAFLLVEGPQALQAAERPALARWLDSCPPDKRADLVPETPDEAGHVLDFACDLLAGDFVGPTAPAAMLALEACEAILAAGDPRRVAALIVAAHAGLRSAGVAADAVEVLLPPDIEALMARARALAPGDLADWSAVMPLLGRYADYLFAVGCNADAEAALRLMLQLVGPWVGSDAARHAELRENLAALLSGDGRHDEAESLFRAALEIRRMGGGDAAIGLWRTWLGLAALLAAQSRHAAAEDAAVEALQTAARAFGEDSQHAAACRGQLRVIRAAILHEREGGRVFGVLRRSTGDRFTRAVSALMTVADATIAEEAADLLVVAAARLQARAGCATAALDLVERQLLARRIVPGLMSDEEIGVCTDAVGALLAEGRTDEAHRILDRGFDIAERADAIQDADDIGFAQRDLIKAIAALDHEAAAALLHDVVRGDGLYLLREHELERAVDRGDLAAAAAIVAAWDERWGVSDDWVLRHIGAMAATAGDLALVRRMADWLLPRDRGCFGIEVLLAAGLEEEAMAALGRIGVDWSYACALAFFAAYHAKRGDAARFAEFAALSVDRTPDGFLEGSELLRQLAVGAHACLPRARALAWAATHLPAKVQRSFEAMYDSHSSPDGRRAAPPELPALAEAIAGRDWDGALAALVPASNFYSDVEHASRLAVPAAEAGRRDVAVAALDFALARLVEPFDGNATRMTMSVDELRQLAARRLGELARGLLPADMAARFADQAFARAASLADQSVAAALVVAGGIACRPGPPRTIAPVVSAG